MKKAIGIESGREKSLGGRWRELTQRVRWWYKRQRKKFIGR